MQRIFYGDCKFSAYRQSETILTIYSRYVYAYSMGQISNRKRVLGNLILADTDMDAPRLSIYLGFTEDILKICACVAELPALAGDDISLRLAIASMYVYLILRSQIGIY
jgi:hypothetical protein